VTFENGREGIMKADLKVRDCETYAAVKKAS
jgi:hypothetical protein